MGTHRYGEADGIDVVLEPVEAYPLPDEIIIGERPLRLGYSASSRSWKSAA